MEYTQYKYNEILQDSYRRLLSLEDEITRGVGKKHRNELKKDAKELINEIIKLKKSNGKSTHNDTLLLMQFDGL